VVREVARPTGYNGMAPHVPMVVRTMTGSGFQTGGQHADFLAMSVRQRQARALGWAEIKQFLETAGESLPATRERALICMAYDTMARRSELIAFDLDDFDFLPDATGRALIRRSKTDQVGRFALSTTITIVGDEAAIGFKIFIKLVGRACELAKFGTFRNSLVVLEWWKHAD
jgi:hypothetical protein